MTCTESNESYGFSLTSMTSIVPELHKITEVIVTDRLPSEDIFFKLLKSIKLAALCNWHLAYRNLAEWVRYDARKGDIISDFENWHGRNMFRNSRALGLDRQLLFVIMFKESGIDLHLHGQMLFLWRLR